MIIFIIIGVVCIVAAVVLYDVSGSPKTVPAADSKQLEFASLGAVPKFSFETIDGRKASISDFKGRVVIMNFWATWCSTCVIEMPDMLNLVDSYGGKVVFLAVSSDMKVESIDKFIAGNDDNIKTLFKSNNVYVVMDDKRAITYDLFMTEKYPETIIIAPDGEMVRKIVGEFDWSGDDIKLYLNNLI